MSSKPGKRSVLRRAGKPNHQPTATNTDATPPITIAMAGPKSWPVTPDSNAPSSFDAPMSTISIASTRPRISAGVTSGTSVALM